MDTKILKKGEKTRFIHQMWEIPGKEFINSRRLCNQLLVIYLIYKNHNINNIREKYIVARFITISVCIIIIAHPYDLNSQY